MTRLHGRLALLAVFGVLLLPAQAQAAPDECARFGCTAKGPIKPARDISNWYQTHAQDSFPPAGCRWLKGTSRGVYPAAVISFTPFKLQWLTSYRLHARLTYCWTANNVVGEYHPSGQRIIRERLKLEVWWSDVVSATDAKPDVPVRKRWYDCMIMGRVVPKGCVDIKVQGHATVDIPPGLGFTNADAYPYVEFVQVAADGTHKAVNYDGSMW